VIDGTACLAKLLNDEDLIDTFSSQGLQVLFFIITLKPRVE